MPPHLDCQPANSQHNTPNIFSLHPLSHKVTVASHHSSDEEEPEYLPYPATKLIVAQYWHCSRDPPFWGYLIVGTFYDQHNNIVWSTEIFAFQPDTRRDRDTQSDASSGSDVESTSGRNLNDQFARSLSIAPSTSARSPAYASGYQSRPRNTQHYWDPALAGPVPGHWVTEYDRRLGNWVNTWQPDHPHF
ncbi:hypothetical protein ColTof4_04544 [Colletotrichum tofieldiae]|nr:hypothetical protein ColTof3_11220 [Colletotrichum tofieldiae]GKT72121.1 hypothetical protein ColTof4_04544 [Colletotrichum tofieldiae]